MASIPTTVSPRQHLAVAAAVTGLVLAGAVTLATLLGWLQSPSTVSASATATDANPTVATEVNASGPQVVLVPVAPALGASELQRVSGAAFGAPDPAIGATAPLPTTDAARTLSVADEGREDTGSSLSNRSRRAGPSTAQFVRGEHDDD